MAVIGEQLGSRAQRDARWRQRLATLECDPDLHLIDWPESQRTPILALQLRLSLLRRKFDVTAGAALTDWPALAPRLAGGDERICFWGSAETIAAVRAWLASGSLPPPGELRGLELGTLTYVCEQHGQAKILIADHLASTTSAVPSLAVGMLTCNALFEEGAAAMRTELRNRRPGGRAPSGIAGHIGSVREIGTSYWGVVPWYVGWGAQEMLDYCELPARPELTRRLIREAGDLLIADPTEREFAAALIKLNLGEQRDAQYIRRPQDAGRMRGADRAQATGHAQDAGRTQNAHCPQDAGRKYEPSTSAAIGCTRWELHIPSPLLMSWQRLVLRPSAEGQYADLGAALSAAFGMPRAIVLTAEIPLGDPAFMDAQRELTDAGFLLSALAPPIACEGERLGFVGLWSWVGSGLPIAAPYYLASRLLNDREREVVSHVERISQCWDRVAQARAA